MTNTGVGIHNKLRLIVSPWAALVTGMIIYSADSHTLLSFFLAVFAHELGHWICLRVMGCRIRALRWELSGLCIRYAGDPGRWGQAACAIAGPIAGLLYALLAAAIGPSGELSAGISVLLSLFNLIPALPLDGGRAAEALLGQSCAQRISRINAILTIGLGLILFINGRGAALALAGLMLLAAQFRQGSSSAISPD